MQFFPSIYPVLFFVILSSNQKTSPYLYRTQSKSLGCLHITYKTAFHIYKTMTG